MISRRAALLMPLALAGCGSGRRVTRREFRPPDYSYLTPLRLNVASVEIDDRSPPAGSNSLSAMSPLSPVDGLKALARDRLVASGSSGRAVFVIDRASLQRAPGGIDGNMAVRLDIYADAGKDRSGFAEAQVTRRRMSTNRDEDPRAVLYDFVMQMLDDMNVEFEYQVKRSLREWLQLTAGNAPPPSPIVAEPLDRLSADKNSPDRSPAAAPLPNPSPNSQTLTHPR